MKAERIKMFKHHQRPQVGTSFASFPKQQNYKKERKRFPKEEHSAAVKEINDESSSQSRTTFFHLLLFHLHRQTSIPYSFTYPDIPQAPCYSPRAFDRNKANFYRQSHSGIHHDRPIRDFRSRYQEPNGFIVLSGLQFAEAQSDGAGSSD